MSKYDAELLNVVRQSANPDAVVIAIKTIISYLEQHESSQLQEPSYRPERA